MARLGRGPAWAGLIAALLALLVGALGPLATSANPLAFVERWSRADGPVNDLVANRTWIWGPLDQTWRTSEEYAEAPGGKREVMYFDKSRMEITDPDGDQSDLWYVTNGLLVVELMSGSMQVGDDEFVGGAPADVNVAGDPNDPNGITYATLGALRDAPALADGAYVIQRLLPDGSVETDNELANYDVTAAYRVQVPGIDHQVASVFWAFMNSTGTVYEDGVAVTDTLFENPFYGTGYPISEAYWADVLVGGEETTVLMQCFERRCLTYTPSNPAGWQVEAGNVGRHYYSWRYGHEMPGETTATAWMVSLDDGGPVGCGDTLVPVQLPVWATETPEEAIAAAVEMLLAVDDQFYGESGLFNALWQNEAVIAGVTLEDGVATLSLTGTIPLAGACDTPRAEGQLRETVLSQPGVEEVVILLNGEEWPPSGA